MAEDLLVKIALVVTIVGIIILFLISDKVKPREYQINLLSKENLDQLVKIKGEITEIKETQSLSLLTVEDKKGKIKVVLSKKHQIVKPKKGQEVEVIGKFKTFREDFEIDAEEIKIL
ncbi:MAG: OB-fold nucleic acid binding domain-containing protein [Nanoarchaeota archaeon]